MKENEKTREEQLAKSEWSKEDEEKFRDVVRLIEQGAPVQSMRDHYTNWLKSIKDRYTWKPSDEQMKTLNKVIFCTYNANDIEERKHIESLYNDLNKLTK